MIHGFYDFQTFSKFFKNGKKTSSEWAWLRVIGRDWYFFSKMKKVDQSRPKPVKNPWFTRDLPRIDQNPWFTRDLPVIYPWFTHDWLKPVIYPWFTRDLPRIDQNPWFTRDLTVIYHMSYLWLTKTRDLPVIDLNQWKTSDWPGSAVIFAIWREQKCK